jgi:50S ribosomal protein L16 3-hydroxylase
MDIQQPLQLLGGLTPQQFMKRHWQKKPLLVRQAIPGFKPLLERPALFDLAAREEVESRLLSQGSKGWQFRRGPFERRALPALKTRTGRCWCKGWTCTTSACTGSCSSSASCPTRASMM